MTRNEIKAMTDAALASAIASVDVDVIAARAFWTAAIAGKDEAGITAAMSAYNAAVGAGAPLHNEEGRRVEARKMAMFAPVFPGV